MEYIPQINNNSCLSTQLFTFKTDTITVKCSESWFTWDYSPCPGMKFFMQENSLNTVQIAVKVEHKHSIRYSRSKQRKLGACKSREYNIDRCRVVSLALSLIRKPVDGYERTNCTTIQERERERARERESSLTREARAIASRARAAFLLYTLIS